MSAPTVSPWIAGSRASAATGLRLFCLPYAGGGASLYRDWGRLLPPGIAVCPVQLPGREGRIGEEPLAQLEPLVAAMADGLRPWLDRPFALFGHSMGALLGFELARLLRRRRWPGPLQLFVSAHRAPQLPDPEPEVYRLPQPAFLAKLRQLKGAGDDLLDNAELMELLLPTLRADFAVCGTYAYADGPPLDCPIVAFAGTRDAIVAYDEVAAWRAQTRGAFTIRPMAGDHFFLQSAQTSLVWAVGHSLQQELSRSAERAPAP